MNEKYEFTHGREGIALLNGIALCLPLILIIILFGEFVESQLVSRGIIGDYFDDYTVLIAVFVIVLAPAGIMMFFPLKNVNVKAMGILYDDYVEVHLGKKVEKVFYKDILFIRKKSRRGRMTWWISHIYINEPIGILVKTDIVSAQIDAFVGAVEQKKKIFTKR